MKWSFSNFPDDIYMQAYYIDLNKLFCSFTPPENLEFTIEEIKRRYTILFDKIFILESPDTEDLICTYNVDVNNLSDDSFIPDTILLHRKKETNTLYSINALNCLIMSLNNGNSDHNFPIDWKEYKNSILLTRNGEFYKINTKIYNIVYLN